MKNPIYYGLLTSLIFTLPSCQSPEQRAVNHNNSQDTTLNESSVTTGSKEMNNSGTQSAGSEDHNYSFHTKVSDDDHKFLNDVKSSGMMEITLATIAQKSKDPKVKAFADMMIADHRKIDKEAEALATAAKIILRIDYTAKQQEDLKMMKGLSGAEFDKHYKEMMVKDHGEAVKLFQNGMNTREEVVKEFATRTLATIQSHYKAAKTL
jgi:putative membrane protein